LPVVPFAVIFLSKWIW